MRHTSLTVSGCSHSEANGVYKLEQGTAQSGHPYFLKRAASNGGIVVDFRGRGPAAMWVMTYAWDKDDRIFAKCPGSENMKLPPTGEGLPWMLLKASAGGWVEQTDMRVVLQQELSDLEQKGIQVSKQTLRKQTPGGILITAPHVLPAPVRSTPAASPASTPRSEARKDSSDEETHSTCASSCGTYKSGWGADIDAHLLEIFKAVAEEGKDTLGKEELAQSAVVQREFPFLVSQGQDQIDFATFKSMVLEKSAGLVRVQVLRKKFNVYARSRSWKSGQIPAVRREHLVELVENAFPNHDLDAEKLKAASLRISKNIWINCNTFIELTTDVQEYLQYRLSEVVGLKSLKDRLTAFCHGAILDKRRSEIAAMSGSFFLPSRPRHMLFRGNPGTGKTSVARLVGDMLLKAGLVQTGKFVYAQREDFVGSCVGKTAQLTKAKVEEAKGGVLFVDEAYRLFPKDADSKDFGKEAVDELMAAMLTDDGPLMIFAGYPKGMDGFIQANPGLRSRIPNTFDFEDFSWSELALILDQMVEKAGLRWAEEVQLQHIADALKRATPAGAAESMNGRICELTLMFAKQRLDQRLVNFSDGDDTDQLFEISLADLREGCALVPKPADPRIACLETDGEDINMEDVQDPKAWLKARLSKLVGLQDLKEQIQVFQRGLILDQERAKQGRRVATSSCNHMVFAGSAGTGKTTVARIMSELLQRAGLIETRKLVEVQREAFLGDGLVGSTEAATAQVLESARGGVLFIDNAHRLCDDCAGRQAIQTIVSHMLAADAPIMIFAVPREKVAEFVQSNSSFASRVPYSFEFADYLPESLSQIFQSNVVSAGFDLAKDIDEGSIVNIFEACKHNVRAQMNGHLCKLACKFAKEALDADCLQDSGSVSCEFTLSHIGSGVQRATQMYTLGDQATVMHASLDASI